MDIVEELIKDFGGTYKKDDVKKGHTPGGAFISQNSYGIVKKQKYSIEIYCFANTGIRANYTIDGSPYKITLITPHNLKKSLSIFPITFFQKIIGNSIADNILSPSGKLLLKRYSVKGEKELLNHILNDEILAEMILLHNVYITTSIHEKYTVLSLRPNESVIDVNKLKELYNIMDRFGEVFTHYFK